MPAIGTLFTLFVVPVLYLLIGRDHRQRSDMVAHATV